MDLEDIGQVRTFSKMSSGRGHTWGAQGGQLENRTRTFDIGKMDEEAMPDQTILTADLNEYGTVCSQMTAQSVVSITSKIVPRDYCALMDNLGNKVAWALPSDGITAVCEGSLPIGMKLFWCSKKDSNGLKKPIGSNEPVFVSEKALVFEKKQFPLREIATAKRYHGGTVKAKIRSSSAEHLSKSHIEGHSKKNNLTSSTGTRIPKVGRHLGKRARSPPILTSKYLR